MPTPWPPPRPKSSRSPRLEHPNIVQIYNFVEHVDSAGVPVGYIVMEIRRRHVAESRSARPAMLRFTRTRRLPTSSRSRPHSATCTAKDSPTANFKPGQRDARRTSKLKLIDLGAVIAMDDMESSLFGTVGYQAPEIAETGPTVASDVYTVRAHASPFLVMDVPQEHGRFRRGNYPARRTVPVSREARFVVPRDPPGH